MPQVQLELSIKRYSELEKLQLFKPLCNGEPFLTWNLCQVLLKWPNKYDLAAWYIYPLSDIEVRNEAGIDLNSTARPFHRHVCTIFTISTP